MQQMNERANELALSIRSGLFDAVDNLFQENEECIKSVKTFRILSYIVNYGNFYLLAC